MKIKYTLGLILILSIFLGGLVWADTNGVWHNSEDIIGGIFGSDEQTALTQFSFINKVFFNDLVTINANTQINGNIDVTGNITMTQVLNCNGKLSTDSSGKIVCGVDMINDGDFNSSNELQNLNSVLLLGNNADGQRITNVANPINSQDVATKDYVDLVASSSNYIPSTRVATYTQSAWRWPSGTANCNLDEIVVGGGASCTSPVGWMFIAHSIPSGNGWYAVCDTPEKVTATIVVYAICLKK